MTTEPTLWWWVAFNAFVLAMLAIDLLVFHRKCHEVKLKEALAWSGVWIGLAALFNLWLFMDRGAEVGLNFLTGYLIEKSLSVDNVFVFAMLFAYFAVPKEYQHKVLFWGILGALVFRAIFIFAGVALIERFEWTIYIFGALLVVTGVKMWRAGDKKMDLAHHPVLRLVNRFVPLTRDFAGGRFFTRVDGRWFATPLLLVLVLIETSDIIFAVDSIPAILAITTDPFIVYTANVFAILGLRALYHALAGIMNLFHHLHHGLSIILVFVGMKMLVHAGFGYKIPVGISLGVVATVIAGSIAASLLWPRAKREEHPRAAGDPLPEGRPQLI